MNPTAHPETSRRGFLRTSAGAALGSTLASPLVVSAAPAASSDTLKVGLVGCADGDVSRRSRQFFGGGRQLDDRGAGLYRLKFGSKFDMTLVRGAVEQKDEPLLVFLHGTASSTRGSFGKLWDAPDSEREKALAALTACASRSQLPPVPGPE